MYILASLPFLLFSAFFAWSATKDIIEVVKLKKKGVLTSGIVNNVEEFEDTDGDGHKVIRYKLQVDFTTVDGLKISGEIVKSENYYHIGLEVHILYDLNNPSDFLVNDPEGSEAIGVGICFILFAIVFGVGTLWITSHMN